MDVNRVTSLSKSMIISPSYCFRGAKSFRVRRSWQAYKQAWCKTAGKLGKQHNQQVLYQEQHHRFPYMVQPWYEAHLDCRLHDLLIEGKEGWWRGLGCQRCLSWKQKDWWIFQVRDYALHVFPSTESLFLYKYGQCPSMRVFTHLWGEEKQFRLPQACFVFSPKRSMTSSAFTNSGDASENVPWWAAAFSTMTASPFVRSNLQWRRCQPYGHEAKQQTTGTGIL